jgi:hypothetical protein
VEKNCLVLNCSGQLSTEIQIYRRILPILAAIKYLSLAFMKILIPMKLRKSTWVYVRQFIIIIIIISISIISTNMNCLTS